MTDTQGNEARGDQVELTIRTGRVCSPVDPGQQLSFATLSRLLRERVDQIRGQWEQEWDSGSMLHIPGADVEMSIFSMVNIPGPCLAGMPACEEALWEFICTMCGHRTAHSVCVYAYEVYRNWHFHTKCIGSLYDRIRERLSTIVSLDLELVPIGFCAHCAPDVREPTAKLVVRFPDAPERNLAIKKAQGGLACLEEISRSECRLNYTDCYNVAGWLGIDLSKEDKP